MRVDIDLRARYRYVLSATGLLLACCGLIVLSPLVALACWPAEAHLARGFVLPGLLLAGGGAALWRLLRPQRRLALTVQDGGVIVLLAWVTVCLASALTLIRVADLDFAQAVFESVSGWTTTGLSVVDVERAPHVVLLWRSIMQLAGGAGMAILLVTLAGGPLAPGLAAAEGRSDQLVPHVRRSARLVLTLYAGYAIVGVLALRSAGMSWFDAVNHAFAAVSTGGFSTRGASVGHFGSLAVEAVTIPLMILGNLNFQVVYLALAGRCRSVLHNGEVRTAVLLTVVGVPLLAWALDGVCTGTAQRLRVATFELVTALTTTGFSVSAGAIYKGWPPLATFLLVPLMLVGGGTGSTAGGIKQQRVYLLARAVWWELERQWLPRRAILDTSVWQADAPVAVADRGVVQAATYVVGYLLLYLFGTTVLVACGFGVQQSLFEYASALGTVGLSVGVTSPSAPRAVLWAETAGMLLGRLEIFIVLVALRRLLADAAAGLRGARR